MSNPNLSTLEKYVSRYPWFSAGYLDIYSKLKEMGLDTSGVYLTKTASHIFSRAKLYRISKEDVADKEEVKTIEIEEVIGEREEIKEIISEEEIAQEVEMITEKESLDNKANDEILEIEEGQEYILEEMFDLIPGHVPRIVLVGGDYFSRKELEELELDKNKPVDSFIVEKPSLLKSSILNRESQPIGLSEIDTAELFDDSEFYTETLANIYMEQGFHKRALDVYAKLILLYPEKSSYFATLVKEIKNKYNL